MADKPVAEVVNVDSALDALSSPTSSDVYEALLPFSNDAAVASAASLALAGGGGGGGGSLPEGWTQLEDGTVVATEPGEFGNEYFKVIPTGSDGPGDSEVFVRFLRVYLEGLVDDADFVAKDSNGDIYFKLTTGDPGEVFVNRIVGPSNDVLDIQGGATTGTVRIADPDYVMELIVAVDGILLHGLPTEDPLVPDALWRDEGTIKISASI